MEEFEYELDTRYGIINFLSCDSVITVTQGIVFTLRILKYLGVKYHDGQTYLQIFSEMYF